MKPTDENLLAPISGQFKSSPFYVAISSLPLSAIISIFLTWLVYATLPKEAADALAPQLQLFVLGTGAVGSGGGVLGMVKRGLDITSGKIAVQGAPPVPETVNAAGNVTLGSVPVSEADLEPENLNIEVINADY